MKIDNRTAAKMLRILMDIVEEQEDAIIGLASKLELQQDTKKKKVTRAGTGFKSAEEVEEVV